MRLEHFLAHLIAVVPRTIRLRVLVSPTPPPRDFGSFVSCRNPTASLSHHVMLEIGEKKDFEFMLQETGRFDVAVDNPSESFCVITGLCYLGRMIHAGSCVRASGEGQSGQLLLVRLARLNSPRKITTDA